MPKEPPRHDNVVQIETRIRRQSFPYPIRDEPARVIPFRQLHRFSDPIWVLKIAHLDGRVERREIDMRRGLMFVGWSTDKKPGPR